VTKAVLQQAFVPFGEIVEVNMPGDDAQQHRGFGYVEFENPDDAAAAIDNMDQCMLAGRVLSVAQAKPMKETGNLLGSKVAVWEQVSLLWGGGVWVLTVRRRIGSGNMRFRRRIGRPLRRRRRRL
jgi:RNA recognition motif-containing protein